MTTESKRCAAESLARVSGVGGATVKGFFQVHYQSSVNSVIGSPNLYRFILSVAMLITALACTWHAAAQDLNVKTGQFPPTTYQPEVPGATYILEAVNSEIHFSVEGKELSPLVAFPYWNELSNPSFQATALLLWWIGDLWQESQSGNSDQLTASMSEHGLDWVCENEVLTIDQMGFAGNACPGIEVKSPARHFELIDVGVLDDGRIAVALAEITIADGLPRAAGSPTFGSIWILDWTGERFLVDAVVGNLEINAWTWTEIMPVSHPDPPSQP